MNRREFLSNVTIAALLAGGRPLWGLGSAPQVAGLKDLAQPKGLVYGAAAALGSLKDDARFRASILQQCALLVPENELKWSMLRPSSDRFNFGPADWMVNFAQQHKLTLHGHTLTWHQGLPNWLTSLNDAGPIHAALVQHITTVVKRYAGKIASWDVVNEGIQPADGAQDGLRNSFWLKALGPEYIALAFRTAAAADPDARLVYNEHQLEYDTPEQEKRRAAVLHLLERLKKAGVPVHALGVQSHLRAASKAFRPAILRQFFSQVAGLGLKIFLSELDVTDRDLTGSPAQRDGVVARTYADYLAAALEEPAVTRVVTWGLSDRHTWLKYEEPRQDGGTPRPLPLDENLQPTPAWLSIANAFERAPTRP